MHIDILGTPYNIKFMTEKENPKLNDCTGLAELYSKELIIKTGYEDDFNAYNNITAFREKVLRHEILHAIFHECGLTNYTEDEVLIDFLAVQYPKIQAIMEDVHKIHNEIVEANKGADI